MTTTDLSTRFGASAAVVRPGEATTQFRKDIQGLRAVAVLSVALDHADISAFAGGYVGVDVFFVISGFLITQLLLSEAQRTGSISLGRFYNRRARRILPAATLVVSVTVLVSVMLLNFVQATALVKDSIWATFFAANIEFSRQQTDYFAADNPASPLQHFWSLAVEEQFYLVWPLLLAALLGGFLVWRRRAAGTAPAAHTGRLPRGRIVAALAVVGGASLVWSIVLTGRQPTVAYFSTFARAWELALGAACAVLAPALATWPSAIKAAMAWTGLVGVLASVVGYSASTPFPGYAALGPVIGSALIIAGGCGVVRGGPRVLLDHRPFQLVGDWSYSLYLWHWPFLVIAAAYAGHALTPYQNLALLVAALGVSILTYRWVEDPVRRSRGLSSKVHRGLLLYPAAVVTTLVACLIATQVVNHEIAVASSAPAVTLHNFGVPDESSYTLSPHRAIALVQASSIAAQHDMAVPGHLAPSLLDLEADVADVGSCDYVQDTRAVCPRGVVGSSKVLVAFGDSHARAWIPTLERIAQRQGYVTYYLVKPGCDAAQIVPQEAGGPFESCLAWRAWAMQTIVDLHPDITFLANNMPGAVVQSDGTATDDPAVIADAFRTGLEQTIRQLGQAAGHIVVMGDVPGLRRAPGSCLAGRGATLGDCASTRSHRSKLLRTVTREAAAATGAPFIDPTPWFCAYHLCPAVIGSTVVYRDKEHISTQYAEKLARPLWTALRLSSTR